MRRVFTIGHSTRTAEEFLALLRAYDIRNLVDVRTLPRSAFNPQFSQEVLAPFLEKNGIKYFHAENLGGLRHEKKDSLNTAWRNASFRGYADYMGTDEFREGIEWLEDVSQEGPTAIMCAEAVPWRCHRSLISDAFTAGGGEVFHIFSETNNKLHGLNPSLRMRSGRITYPRDDQGRLGL